MPTIDQRIEEWLELNNSDKRWFYDVPGSLITMAEEIFRDIRAERERYRKVMSKPDETYWDKVAREQ